MENYSLQENDMEKLFHRRYNNNTDIEDVLIKVSTLNDFYSTNIFSPFRVAKHIVSLDIDDRLRVDEVTLVNEIAKVKMDKGNGKECLFLCHKVLQLPYPNGVFLYMITTLIKSFTTLGKWIIFIILRMMN